MTIPPPPLKSAAHPRSSSHRPSTSSSHSASQSSHTSKKPRMVRHSPPPSHHHHHRPGSIDSMPASPFYGSPSYSAPDTGAHGGNSGFFPPPPPPPTQSHLFNFTGGSRGGIPYPQSMSSRPHPSSGAEIFGFLDESRGASGFEWPVHPGRNIGPGAGGSSGSAGAWLDFLSHGGGSAPAITAGMERTSWERKVELDE